MAALRGFWLEQPGGRPAACHLCGAPCGDPLDALDEQAEGGAGDNGSDHDDSAASREPLPPLPPLPSDAGGGAGSAADGGGSALPADAARPRESALCRLGCGLPFCSAECEAADKGHALLCVGPLDSEDHPLVQLRERAFSAGGGGVEAALVLGLAAKIVASEVAAAPEAEPALGGPASPRPQDSVWASCHLDPDDAAVAVGEVWALLEASLRERAAAAQGEGADAAALRPWHTAERWARLVDAVHAHRVDVELPNPLVEYCRRLALVGDAAALRAAEDALRRRGVVAAKGDRAAAAGAGSLYAENSDNLGGEGSASVGAGPQDRAATDTVDGGDDDGSDFDDDSDGVAAAPPSMSQLLAQPEAYLPPISGAAFFHELAALPHSCVPSAAAVFDRGDTATLRPRPGGACNVLGECWCRVSTQLDLSDRKEELEARGLAAPCDCPRCRFERSSSSGGGGSSGGMRHDGGGSVDWSAPGGGPSVDTPVVDSAVAKLVAELAEDDHRYEDAVTARRAVVAALPGDADARYALSRACGWADRWSEARRVLVSAARDFPDHAQTAEVLRARESFYCGRAWKRSGRVLPSAAAAASAAGAAADAAEPVLASVEFDAVNVGCDGDDVGAAAFVSHGPLLSPRGCAAAVRAVEAHAAARDGGGGGGWTTSRHYSVPTTDVPVHEVAEVLAWFNQELEASLLPAVGGLFGLDPDRVRVIDAFVVKYTADKQRLLPVHTDQSQVSLTIALNPLGEYDGGGTYFVDADTTVRCDAGGVVAFSGAVAHAGGAVLRGVRYIVAAFLYEEQDGGDDDDGGDDGGPPPALSAAGRRAAASPAAPCELLLKPATADDAAEVMAVVNAAYAVEIGSTGVAFKSCNRYVDQDQVVADIASAASGGGDDGGGPVATRFVVARLGRRCCKGSAPIVGCIRAEVRDAADGSGRLCEFGPFAVSPAAQGGGVGAALLAEVEAFARSAGASRLEIYVVNHRADAVAWYERRGFGRTGETRPFVGNFGKSHLTRPSHFVVLTKP